MTQESDLLIALEGGGTRSQAALMDMTGRLLQIKEAGDVNTNFTTHEQARQAVHAAVDNVLQAAGVEGDRVAIFASALVGPAFGAETFGSRCPNARFFHYREQDVVFARAGIYRPHGIALVAATGASAFGIRLDNGRRASFGGWGSLLGDEGSAFALGLLAIRAAVRAYEGRETQPTRLVDALCSYLHIQNESFQSELIRLAYGKPLSRSDIAGFAANVSCLAVEGDLVATRICAKVAADLAALALHAARTLFNPAEIFDLVVAGGLINAGDLILGPLSATFQQDFPHAIIHTGTEQPAVALGRFVLHHSSNQESQC